MRTYNQRQSLAEMGISEHIYKADFYMSNYLKSFYPIMNDFAVQPLVIG